MSIDNFNWFLHVMLFYHTQNTLDKIEQRTRKKKDNNNMSDSDNDNDDDEIM